MITLNLQNGARFDLLPSAVTIIEETKATEGTEAGTTVALDFGDGVATEALKDKYGYVRKQVLDTGAMLNPIEVKMAHDKHRVTFSRNAIVARQELKDKEAPGNTLLFVKFSDNAKTLRWMIDDTIAQLDGED